MSTLAIGSPATQTSTGLPFTVKSISGPNAVVTDAQGNEHTIPSSDLQASNASQSNTPTHNPGNPNTPRP